MSSWPTLLQHLPNRDGDSNASEVQGVRSGQQRRGP